MGSLSASQDLFCCPTTLAPTSTAPCGEDVSEDVLGQPWEEITAFCQITTRAFDVGYCKFKDKLDLTDLNPSCSSAYLHEGDTHDHTKRQSIFAATGYESFLN